LDRSRDSSDPDKYALKAMALGRRPEQRVELHCKGFQ
jgi:hypothetical protein